MNLIINIDDENVISDIKNHCLVAQSKTDTVIIDALYNGIPLDDIKAEIEAERDFCAETSVYTRSGFNTSLYIIDKYTKEGGKESEDDSKRIN